MGGKRKPMPMEEFTELVNDAAKIGINVEGLTPDSPELKAISAKVEKARKEAEKSVSKIRVEGETGERLLIRLVEWTDWIPGEPDENIRGAGGKLHMHDGITGVMTGKGEKLIDFGMSGTGVNKDVVRGAGTKKFGCYAFSAVFAQNISEDTYRKIKAAQGGPGIEPDAGRDKKQDLIVPGG